MNGLQKLALLGAAIVQAEYNRFYGENSVKMPEPKESKPLREHTYKGHTIMAYSKDDARNRLLRQGIIKKK